MARLKRTVTKQYTGVPSLDKSSSQAGGSKLGVNRTESEGANVAPQPTNMMEALKAKIAARFLALHPEREEE